MDGVSLWQEIDMPVDEKTLRALDVKKALDLKTLKLPPSLPVTRLEAEDYTDWSGEPSLRVLAVLDESVDVEKVSGEAVGDFDAAIHDSLRKHGITLFPYIFFAKPSELADTDGE